MPIARQYSGGSKKPPPLSHTSEFFRLSHEKGLRSDDYYRAISEWIKNGSKTEGHTERQKLAGDYLVALDRYLEYLQTEEDGTNAEEMTKYATELRTLLQADIDNYRLD